mmetsp:Transcript_44150/g.134448  ORF Transcript_44150/g.134448 Transcript_44150/m.134448 type:complete len:201 (-) Transcript_44150:1444-2046(-)
MPLLQQEICIQECREYLNFAKRHSKLMAGRNLFVWQGGTLDDSLFHSVVHFFYSMILGRKSVCNMNYIFCLNRNASGSNPAGRRTHRRAAWYAQGSPTVTPPPRQGTAAIPSPEDSRASGRRSSATSRRSFCRARCRCPCPRRNQGRSRSGRRSVDPSTRPPSTIPSYSVLPRASANAPHSDRYSASLHPPRPSACASPR